MIRITKNLNFRVRHLPGNKIPAVFNGNGLVSRDLGLTAGILFLWSPLVEEHKSIQNMPVEHAQKERATLLQDSFTVWLLWVDILFFCAVVRLCSSYYFLRSCNL